MTIPNKFNNGELADAPLVNENFDYLDTLTEDIAKNVKLLSDTSTFTKYDETKTYAKDDIVTVLSPDGRIVAYISLKNQNNGNALSDENWWKKTDLGGGNMPVGSIFPHSASATFVPENSLPCDGMEYSKDQFKALYNDFLVLKRLETCTYEQYQQEISATGECLKFALDTAKGMFKVPTKLNKYVSAKQTKLGVVGNGKALGLTNGTEKGYLCGWIDGRNNTSQYSRTNTLQSATQTNAFDSAGVFGVMTDASKSGIETTELKTKEIRYFVVVATGSIKQSEMDWSQWASSLQGKLNKDMTNLPVTNDIVIEHKINSDGSWYRKYKSGWLEQGCTYVQVQNSKPTINLPKPYKTKDYGVLITASINGRPASYYIDRHWRETMTPTSFQISSSMNSLSSCSWYTFGQGA